MSDDVRAVAGAQEVGPAVTQAIARLDRWPSARSIGVLLLGSWVAVTVGWPLIAAVGAGAATGGALDLLDLVTLAAVGVNVGLTLPLQVLARASDRRAYAWIGCRFAAAPPLLDAPHACRSCAGPLPDPYGRSQTPAVVRCAWCGTESVVGLGLVSEAAAARDGAGALIDEATRLESVRSARRRRATASLVLLVATPIVLADLAWRAF